MKLSQLLALSALLASIFGLALMFIPDQVLPLFGLGPGRAGVLVTRVLGAALLGFGVLDWASLGTSDPIALRAITMGNCAASGLGFVILLTAQGQGIVSGLGWTTVTLALIFTLAFAYFYLTTTGQR